MTFREIVDSPCGIRYCFDSLELQSGYARKSLLSSEMMNTKGEIEAYYASLKFFVDLVEKDKLLAANIQFKLQELRDISGTLISLSNESLLNDIELFEIKHLALLGEQIQKLFNESSQNWLECSMSRVISILDPDGLKIGTFYIYDSYSMDLRSLRKALEADPENTQIRDDIENEEERIRKVLCSLLSPYSEDLTKLLYDLAQLDILIAKALQINNNHFVIPKLAQKCTITGMFHPEVRAALSKVGKEFQKVDFEYEMALPTTIIGANMGGKTVALKSLTLCQYLFQFGFGIPAEDASLTLFDEIYFCIGDEQDLGRGLSSFAAEMLRINNVITRVESGKRVLALIDEPARTTNPIEGTALVSALLKVLSNRENLALVVTTHYKVQNSSQCYRVKGLVERDYHGGERLKMDYTLVKSSDSEVPHEAINIAHKLEINPNWLQEAKKLLIN